jgi:hypothetical protein
MLGTLVDRHGIVDEAVTHPTEIIYGLPQFLQVHARILLQGGALLPSKSLTTYKSSHHSVGAVQPAILTASTI